MGFRFKKSVTSLLQLTSANVAVKFLSLLMIALFTRYLTKEELAILPVYEMLAALSGIFFGFGLQPTFIRLLPSKYSENPDEARGLIFSGGLLLVSGSLAFACGVFFLADWLSPILFREQDFAHLIRIFSLGFFFLSLKNVSNLVLWSKSRFDRISVIQITTAVGRTVFVGGLMLLWDVRGMTIGLVCNEILGAGLSLYFIRDILRGHRVPLFPMKGLLKQSFPFYFEGFLIYFRSQGDNWIVATMLGPSTMAIYFIAKRLPGMMMMFIESLDKVVTSEISKRKNNTPEMKSYIRRLFLLNSHVTLPGTIFVMGLVPLFILIVAGKAYMASVVPCLILCSVLPLQALQIPLGPRHFRHPSPHGSRGHDRPRVDRPDLQPLPAGSPSGRERHCLEPLIGWGLGADHGVGCAQEDNWLGTSLEAGWSFSCLFGGHGGDHAGIPGVARQPVCNSGLCPGRNPGLPGIGPCIQFKGIL